MIILDDAALGDLGILFQCWVFPVFAKTTRATRICAAARKDLVDQYAKKASIEKYMRHRLVEGRSLFLQLRFVLSLFNPILSIHRHSLIHRRWPRDTGTQAHPQIHSFVYFHR